MTKLKTSAKHVFEDFFGNATDPTHFVDGTQANSEHVDNFDYSHIYNVDIDALRPFGVKGIAHPFKQYNEDRMKDLVESIQKSGILNPILVRSSDDLTFYEIISGHNRVEAAKQAGLVCVPAIIKQINDDDAAIAMVDSNLRQREKLLHSEKAFAYKIKLDAIKRQGARTDLSCAQNEHRINGKKSRDIIADESGESRAQVTRYIRLTNLIPLLLNKVDSGTIPFITGVSLSYLSEEQQGWLLSIMNRDKFVPSGAQANLLKELNEKGKLDLLSMDTVLSETNKKSRQVLLKQDNLNQYFHSKYSSKEIEEVIYRLLDEWHKGNPENDY